MMTAAQRGWARRVTATARMPIASIVGFIVFAGAAAGQAVPVGSVRPPLEPVEPGVGDVSPLQRSLRRVESGLALPMDFSTLYRLPGDSDRYLRASGGLYATFPRSVYESRTGEGAALIPAGTVFHIGPPSANLTPGMAPGLAPGGGWPSLDGSRRDASVRAAAVRAMRGDVLRVMPYEPGDLPAERLLPAYDPVDGPRPTGRWTDPQASVEAPAGDDRVRVVAPRDEDADDAGGPLPTPALETDERAERLRALMRQAAAAELADRAERGEAGGEEP